MDRSGDEAAFLALWRELQPPLLRYLRVFGCDDPDDVASETWFQVLRDLHKFSGDDADFRRWLFTVARHRAISPLEEPNVDHFRNPQDREL